MANKVPIESIEFYDINSDKFTEVFEVNDEYIQISPGRKIKISNIVRGYTYIGIANTDTVPIDHPFKSYYLAVKPGQYENFGLTLNSNEIGIFLYNQQSWVKESIPHTPVELMTEDQYNQLVEKDENTLYLIYEPE